MKRFEANYPINARQKEIGQILAYVSRGQSCQLISVPGAGRSTVIRLLAFHPKLVAHHLRRLSFRAKSRNLSQPNVDEQDPSARRSFSVGMTGGYLFVYANFAEVPSFDTNELNKFLFLAILSSIQDSPEVNLYQKLYSLFKEALSLNDPQLLFQNFKKALQQITFRGLTPIFLFDRFSEFSDKVPEDFYAALYSLRIAGGKIPIVFSAHRPLVELLPPDITQKFDQFFVDNLVYLESYDEVTNNTRIALLEKEYNKKLPAKIRDELIKLTGGHGKLTKLAAQILLSEDLQRNHPRGGVAPAAHPAGENITGLLLSHVLIKNSLLEVWQSLPTADRETSFFPLYEEFIKRKIPQALVPKVIRFNQPSNEIYFGDQSLSDLTAQEFKLLKFLIQNPQRVVARDEVINAVWADSKTQAGVSDEALDQMVYRVRRKIEDEADNPKHLLTVKGRGFRFLPSLPINNPQHNQ